MTTAPITSTAEGLAWYHTIELPGETTRGMYDTRPAARALPLPNDLAGSRCLDVGTADGYWAFELERRGADEVVAIDLPNQATTQRSRQGQRRRRHEELTRHVTTFSYAKQALESQVEWQGMSVYDLSPEAMGEFDVVFMSSLLLHLREPMVALDAIRSVTTGEFWMHETVSPWMSRLHPRLPAARLQNPDIGHWWVSNPPALRSMVQAAGFAVVSEGGPTIVRRVNRHRSRRMLLRSLARHPLQETYLTVRGIPHHWFRLRPV